jgi:hypothetical protein
MVKNSNIKFYKLIKKPIYFLKQINKSSLTIKRTLK